MYRIHAHAPARWCLCNHQVRLLWWIISFVGLIQLLCVNPSQFFDVCNSVHHHTIQTNQPTRCNSFTSLLFDVYVWLNMFRAPLRPLSEAYNCTRSLWFYRWSVAVGTLLVVVWQVNLPVGRSDHDKQHRYHHVPTVNQRLLLQLLSSWWWAWRCPKHVELYLNDK
jgi:hypothetical protein